MTRLRNLHRTAKGRFERTQNISFDGDHDEPPAKRLARGDSTSSVMSLESKSEESNGSMDLGSSDSESDESGSDDDERDE